jgi:periplasmic protein TonB
LLARSLSWLAEREPAAQSPARPPIDMQLVEIAPPALSRAPSPADTTAAPSNATPAHHVANTTDTTPHGAPATSSMRSDTPTNPGKQASRTAEAAHATRSETRSTAAVSNTDAASSTHAEPSTASSASNPENTNSTAAASENAPSPTTSGTAQARLLSQPIPVLPDDLREQGYQLTAVAHFTIHADGSIDVELIKPTQNPRLNQILLDTLHRWRFFPAMQNGHPVDSEQDVRVHFSVS